MRISTSWSYQQSVNTMLNQQAELANTQNQVSSGKKINVASDDPTGAGQAVGINHLLASNTQYTTTMAAADTRLSTETTTLGSVTDLLDQARTLGLSAVNGTLGTQDLKSIATQLTQIRAQLVQLSNTTDSNGDALFAGTSTTSTPFVQGADGSVSYNGTDGQLMASIGSGLQVATGDPGSEIFMNNANGNGTFVASAGSTNTGGAIVGASSVTDSSAYSAGLAAAGGSYTISFDGNGNWSALDSTGTPVTDSTGAAVGGTYKDGDSISFNGMTVAVTGTPAAGDTISVAPSTNQSIFSTLDNMISTLTSGATGAQVANSMNRQIEALDATQGAVTDTQVKVGSRLSTLDAQTSAYSDLKITYTDALSGVQDVDAASAISQLSLQSAALTASQQVFAKVQSLTLFNYIK